MKTVLHRIKGLLIPRSLRLQLLSRSLFILSALLVLIGIFQYIIMSHFLYQNTAANIRNEIRNAPPGAWAQFLGGTQSSSTTSQQSQSGTQGTTQNGNQSGSQTDSQNENQSGSQATQSNSTSGRFGDRSFFSFNITSIALITANNQFSNIHGLAPQLSTSQYQTALQSPREDMNYQIVRDSQGNKQLIVLQPVTGPNRNLIGLIQIGTSVEVLQHVLLEQLLIFIALALSALVVGLFTFLPILKRTLVPLSQMITTVKRINAGNLDERLTTENGQTEIELLSSSFNEMLDRLESSFATEREAKEKMRQFVADASHELRTPLTSIHGFLEVLLRGAAEKPEQLHRALRSMYGESERIKKLVQDLLLLAQLDREPRLILDAGNLDEVVHDMEPQLRLLAGERKIVFDISDKVVAHFDADKMKQVILNLFHNAIQHTDPTAGKIEVRLYQDNKATYLKMRDNGQGMAPEVIEKVFERFYRVDTARSRSHGGAGLGLSITQSIVESHGGTITCDSRPEQGATFTVTLPLVQKP